jgi:hypothetical protein
MVGGGNRAAGSGATVKTWQQSMFNKTNMTRGFYWALSKILKSHSPLV